MAITWNWINTVPFNNSVNPTGLSQSASSSIGDTLSGLVKYGQNKLAKEQRQQDIARIESLTQAYNNYANAIKNQQRPANTNPYSPIGLANQSVNTHVSNTAITPKNGLSAVPAQTSTTKVPPVVNPSGRIYTGMPDAKTIAKAKQWIPMMQEVSKQTGMPLANMMGIVQAESDFNPNVTSHTGVKGIMQTTRDVMKEMGYDPNLRTDPKMSLLASSRYIMEKGMPYNKNNWLNTYYWYNGGYHGVDGITTGNWKSWTGNATKQREIKQYGPKVERFTALWDNLIKNNPSLLGL